MRPEIDLYVMQDMGEIARAASLSLAPVNAEIDALLEALRLAMPNG